MTQTFTKTITYTVADVSRTFESFRSNLRAYSESAGVDEELVDARADDVIAYARAKYLSAVSVILSDSQGARRRVAKFVVSPRCSMNLGVGWLRTGVFNVADLAIIAGVLVLAFTPGRPPRPSP